MPRWRRLTDRRAVWALLVALAALLLWEASVDLLGVRRFLLPPPHAVLADLAHDPAYFARESAFTLATTLGGFALSVGFGLLMAIGIVQFRFLDRTLYTLLVLLNAIPKVALAPIFVIWLGTGMASKIAIAFMIAIFSIVIDGVLGLRSVDPDILDLARISRAGRLRVLLKLQLPSALPSLFAGMKIAISFALVGAIVGEFVAGEVGLGSVIMLAQGMFNTTRAFSALVLLAVMGTLLFFAVEQAERLLIPWHASQRSGRAAGRPG